MFHARSWDPKKRAMSAHEVFHERSYVPRINHPMRDSVERLMKMLYYYSKV